MKKINIFQNNVLMLVLILLLSSSVIISCGKNKEEALEEEGETPDGGTPDGGTPDLKKIAVSAMIIKPNTIQLTFSGKGISEDDVKNMTLENLSYNGVICGNLDLKTGNGVGAGKTPVEWMPNKWGPRFIYFQVYSIKKTDDDVVVLIKARHYYRNKYFNLENDKLGSFKIMSYDSKIEI